MTKSSLLRSDSERKFTPPTEFPKRITSWHNVYDGWVSHEFFTRSHADEHHDACKAFKPRPRLCVYRIERDEDGSNPEIFVEKVEDFKEEV